jgi:hypothetical protein
VPLSIQNPKSKIQNSEFKMVPLICVKILELRKLCLPLRSICLTQSNRNEAGRGFQKEKIAKGKKKGRNKNIEIEEN